MVFVSGRGGWIRLLSNFARSTTVTGILFNDWLLQDSEKCPRIDWVTGGFGSEGLALPGADTYL